MNRERARRREPEILAQVTRALPLLSGVLASGASSAHAYCRTHTEDEPASTSPEDCTELGLPLYWRDPDISYAFNVRGFPGVSDAELRASFARAFSAWEQVSCDGQPVGFTFTQLAETSTLEDGPKEDEPNLNMIVHYDPAAWYAADNSLQAIALTSTWYSEKTGRIGGADILFNGAYGPFTDCELQTCSETGPFRTDLLNVATHEIGHLLGLSHSKEEGSTMSYEADLGEVEKRTLEADDIAGLCAAYPPGAAFTDGSDGGCSLAGSNGGASALLLVLALVARRALKK